MKKIGAFILINFLISCQENNDLEHYFVNNKDEFWAVYNYSDSPFEGTYLCFNKKTYKNFIITEAEPKRIKELSKNGKGVSWSVSKDSFFIVDSDKRKIIFINDKVIILSSEDTLTGKYKHWFLIKEKIDKHHRSSYYYEQVNRRNFGPLPGIDYKKK